MGERWHAADDGGVLQAVEAWCALDGAVEARAHSRQPGMGVLMPTRMVDRGSVWPQRRRAARADESVWLRLKLKKACSQ
eukprot:1342800-Prymnesium_polylepis.1